MTAHPVHVAFPGRLLMIGFGSIGQGVLPLILRHVGISPERITILSAHPEGAHVAAEFGVRFVQMRLTRDNYRAELAPLIGDGDFLLNLSVDVASVALMELAAETGALYLDTCVEPWPGGYTDANVPAAQRTNYALREEMLALRDRLGPTSPTAISQHGANPGLVSHFVKQALLDVAAGLGQEIEAPSRREDWAALAARLGVSVIHIAERDTQVDDAPKPVGEFLNTWSVEGFIGEGSQPVELGWGSHEKALPPDGHEHEAGSRAAIYLDRPGASTQVRTWTPIAGAFRGFLITHGESISIADYLTHRENGEIVYRPTVHYAYHPCDDAVLSLFEFAGREWIEQTHKRILMDEIVSGIDELGVLLAGHGKGAYWYGSQLSIDQARALVPHNNATSLQVTASVLSGLVWAIENPRAGIREPEEIDFRRNLEIAMPYLGPVVGAYSDWTPLSGRERLFHEDLDRDDPWQFKNVRV